jgi:transcriptional regulator with XRE-family HTH domain
MNVRIQNRVELANFLRNRREATSPADLGLPTYGRRRTPGLRRDEVAELASISRTYYERLEQQRGPQPSPTVLAAIARSLRLSVEEREHLYLLAGHAPPVQDSWPVDVDPGLVVTMESLNPTTIAAISDDLGTVLLQNGLSAEIFGDIAGVGEASNLVWRWFTDRTWRASWAPEHTHDETASGLVADLRAVAAQRGYDANTAHFVAKLRAASNEFDRLWDQHEVSRLRPRLEVLRHPRVGVLTLECGVVQGHLPGQRLILFRAEPGTPAVGQLAALAQSAESVRGPGRARRCPSGSGPRPALRGHSDAARG